MKANKRLNRASIVAPVLVAGLALAACGSGASSEEPAGDNDVQDAAEAVDLSPEMEALYTEAQEEGAVVIYGPSQDNFRGAWDIFEQRFPGIEVESEVLFGSNLDSRMEAERQAGSPAVDIIYLAPPELTGFSARGWLAPYAPAGAADLPETYTGPDDMWSTPTLAAYPVIYNEQAVDAAPESHDDLLAPELEGRVGISDPTVGAATAQVFIAAMDAGAIDEAWLQDFAAQEPRVYPSSGNLLQAVASGEVAVGIQSNYANVQNMVADGAPMGFAALDGGMLLADFATALVADAPHPSAAKLLMEWTYTEEGQNALATHAGFYGTMPGTVTPEGAPALDSFENWSLPYATDLATVLPERLAVFTEIFS